MKVNAQSSCQDANQKEPDRALIDFTGHYAHIRSILAWITEKV